MAAAPRFDLPNPDHETQAYWDAARDKRLLIKRCNACGLAHFYPRPFCPHCWSEDVALAQSSGRARLYTWSVIHQNAAPFDARTPYVVAMVDLRMTKEYGRFQSATIPVGRGPWGMALSATGESLYVTNTTDNTMTIIDLRLMRAGFAIPTGKGPMGVAVR